MYRYHECPRTGALSPAQNHLVEEEPASRVARPRMSRSAATIGPPGATVAEEVLAEMLVDVVGTGRGTVVGKKCWRA